MPAAGCWEFKEGSLVSFARSDANVRYRTVARSNFSWVYHNTTTMSDETAPISPRKKIGLSSPSGVDIRHGLFKNDLQIKSVKNNSSIVSSSADGALHRNGVGSSSKPFVICMPTHYKGKLGGKYCNRWYDKGELDEFLTKLEFLMTAFDGTFWVDIDFSALSESTFEKVCNVLNLHETTMRDCLIEDKSVTDTKISQLEDYLFCIVDTLQDAEGSAKTADWETKNMNIILYNKGNRYDRSKGGVATMHNGPIDGPAEIFSRIMDGHKGYIPSNDWIVWAMFDVLTESLIPRIDLTDATVFEIEKDSVPTDINDQSVDQNKILHQIKISRRRLGQLRRSLSSKLELLYNLTTTYKEVYTKDMSIHLKALEAEVKWKTERVLSATENLQSAYQNYLAFVSLQATAASNSANTVLKKITVLLAITTPLNLIASIFGMNVYPLNQVSFAPTHDDNYTLFIVLLFVMSLSSLLLLVVAKGNKWL